MMYEIPGKKGWYFDKEGLLPVDVQQRIHEWAELTFGSATETLPLINRVESEFVELQEVIDLSHISIWEVKSDPHMMKDIKNECADIAITLFRLAGSLGFDLLHEVDVKQTINEGRKWKRHGDGTGQHIKNEEV